MNQHDPRHEEASNERLRQVLVLALGGLALVACLAIAAELSAHLQELIQARQAASSVRNGLAPAGPQAFANVSLRTGLVVEAVVLEPLFLASIVGLVALFRRGSFALALAGLVLFHVAALALPAFVFFADTGASRAHGMAALLVPVIGIPIAEFALWTLFRPGERERYARRAETTARSTGSG